MARAAVKAKQRAQAKAQPAKASRARGRRGHSGGGNPNQQLFFMRLRRRQKWVFVLLALVFAVTFVGVGIGSGNGGGLDQLYSGLFGGGGDAVAKAKAEIKKNPQNAKGYLDLARAYETKSDTPQAVSALQSYLAAKPKDANGWAEVGGLELSQGQAYTAQYQQAQQAAQLADPSQAFQPGGTLGQSLGTNPAFATASQQATSQQTQLYQQAITTLTRAVSDYQHSARLQPRSATAQQELASAAQTAGNFKVAIKAWKRYLKLYPGSPQRGQINALIKKLDAALTPATPAKKPAKK